jgi:hypothetical protein
MRDPQKVQIVFHLGAKKSEGTQRVPVGAPEGMVEWLAPDRCMVTVEDVKRRGKALQAFVETEDGTNLLAGYKRAANILKAAEKDGIGEPASGEGEGAEALLAAALATALS